MQPRAHVQCAGSELLLGRWALRVIWELRETPLTFRDLRERCDAVSPTSLNHRLQELRETGIVELAEAGGYTLSEAGKKLLEAMGSLLDWSADWQTTLAAKAP
jgi:DNA-binding HxlR family transcriptional regulator